MMDFLSTGKTFGSRSSARHSTISRNSRSGLYAAQVPPKFFDVADSHCREFPEWARLCFFLSEYENFVEHRIDADRLLPSAGVLMEDKVPTGQSTFRVGHTLDQVGGWNSRGDNALGDSNGLLHRGAPLIKRVI